MKPRLLLLLVNLALLAAWLGQVPSRPLLARRELAKPRLHSGAYAPRCGTDRAVVPAPRRLRRIGRGRRRPRQLTRRGQTLEELWRAPGDDVAVVSGTANHEPGDVRVSFLVVDAEGASSRFRPRASGSRTRSTLRRSSSRARSSSGSACPAATRPTRRHIYVAHLRLPRPGKYWLLAEPEGGATKVQALGNVVVVEEDSAPDVGDAAIASETPTHRLHRRRLRRS